MSKELRVRPWQLAMLSIVGGAVGALIFAISMPTRLESQIGGGSIPSFAPLARQVMPAVVNINTTKTIVARDAAPPVPARTRPVRAVLRRGLLGALRRTARPVEAAQPRLRLRHRRRRLHRHQPSRRRWRRRHRGAVLERQAVPGEARRAGRQDRRRAAEDPSPTASCRASTLGDSDRSRSATG